MLPPPPRLPTGAPAGAEHPQALYSAPLAPPPSGSTPPSPAAACGFSPHRSAYGYSPLPASTRNSPRKTSSAEGSSAFSTSR